MARSNRDRLEAIGFGYDEQKYPELEDLQDPIMFEFFEDPVMCDDFVVYERQVAIDLIQNKKNGFTGLPVTKIVRAAEDKKKLCQRFIAEREQEYQQRQQPKPVVAKQEVKAEQVVQPPAAGEWSAIDEQRKMEAYYAELQRKKREEARAAQVVQAPQPSRAPQLAPSVARHASYSQPIEILSSFDESIRQRMPGAIEFFQTLSPNTCNEIIALYRLASYCSSSPILLVRNLFEQGILSPQHYIYQMKQILAYTTDRDAIPQLIAFFSLRPSQIDENFGKLVEAVKSVFAIIPPNHISTIASLYGLSQTDNWQVLLQNLYDKHPTYLAPENYKVLLSQALDAAGLKGYTLMLQESTGLYIYTSMHQPARAVSASPTYFQPAPQPSAVSQLDQLMPDALYLFQKIPPQTLQTISSLYYLPSSSSNGIIVYRELVQKGILTQQNYRAKLKEILGGARSIGYLALLDEYERSHSQRPGA